MNDDQWADAIDKMVTGLEQYNASIHALSKKSSNDTQPLAPEQGPTLEEFDQRVKHDLERRIRELQSKGQADFSTVEEKRAYLEKWGPIAEQQYKQEEQETAGKDAREMMQEAYEHIHVHGPFVFLMNQNHNALRGCVTCGATWVGLMAGAEENLRWHPVGELPEEEGG